MKTNIDVELIKQYSCSEKRTSNPETCKKSITS